MFTTHAPKGDTVCMYSLSQQIMQPPCGVPAAMGSVVNSGQNVQEGGLREMMPRRKTSAK